MKLNADTGGINFKGTKSRGTYPLSRSFLSFKGLFFLSVFFFFSTISRGTIDGSRVKQCVVQEICMEYLSRVTVELGSCKMSSSMSLNLQKLTMFIR